MCLFFFGWNISFVAIRSPSATLPDARAVWGPLNFKGPPRSAPHILSLFFPYLLFHLFLVSFRDFMHILCCTIVFPLARGNRWLIPATTTPDRVVDVRSLSTCSVLHFPVLYCVYSCATAWESERAVQWPEVKPVKSTCMYYKRQKGTRCQTISKGKSRVSPYLPRRVF